jgi:homoserine kinase type II
LVALRADLHGALDTGSMMSPLDHAAAEVLSRYPAALRPDRPFALENHGGFSGARLWRVSSAAGPLCLRAWPPHESGRRVADRHRLMAVARAAGLGFVPAVLRAADGATAVGEADRLWELSEWLPGQADYRARPSAPRLQAAVHALAKLHAAWEAVDAPQVGPCPAIRRRLECLYDWRQLLASGWHPLHACPADDPVRPLAERAVRLLDRHLGRVEERLWPWVGVHGPLQPCLCDVWHAHLLFEGERLTGLVDYGAVKLDRVAVDLARLLGSLIEDDDDAWRTGLKCYRRERAYSAEEEALVRALDATGAVLGIVNWLRWLLFERRALDRAAAGRRLGELVERTERWG